MDRSHGGEADGHRNGSGDLSEFGLEQDIFTSPATAHLGQARRTGEREWLAVDNYGQPVATIWTPYRGRPGTFRCNPLLHILYVDAVEADDFKIVLDYALNDFSPLH
jgi:hypothetical protein